MPPDASPHVTLVVETWELGAPKGERRAIMDMEQKLKNALKMALGINNKEASAIMEVWDEVAKREKQKLMRSLAARKFRPAAAALIKLLAKLPRNFMGRLRKKLGLVGAARLAGKITFNLASGRWLRLTGRLIKFFTRCMPGPKKPRPPKKPRRPRPRPAAA
jgi:hypothetical protein